MNLGRWPRQQECFEANVERNTRPPFVVRRVFLLRERPVLQVDIGRLVGEETDG